MFLTTKRFWKRLGIGFAIFAGLLMVANGIAAWWASARLESRLAKLRAAGEPATIAELAPEPIPPEEDAAAYLESIRDELEAFEKEQAAFERTPEGKAYCESTGDDLTPEQIAAIRDTLTKFPTVMPVVQQAVACEQYASKLDFSLDYEQFLEYALDRTSHFRRIARFVRWQMLVLLAEERFDEAIQTGLDLLHLARLHDAEPTLVYGLVGIAVRGITIDALNQTLRTGTVSPEMRELLDQELQRHDDPEWIFKILKSERAYTQEGLTTPRKYRFHPMAWVPKVWQAGIFDGWEKIMPLLEKERHERADHINQLFKSPPSYPTADMMMHLMSPALVAGVTADNRSTALIRSLRILNALQAYREAHGREASGLEDLDLPESATIDPFDGKPLKLKWTDDGWVIYSVGANGVDDGGDFENLADVGLGPIGYTGPE